MTAALRAELLKLLRTRSVVALSGAGVAYALVSLLPPALASPSEQSGWHADMIVGAVRGPLWLLAVVMLWVGVVASAGELRHRTIVSTLLVQPLRSRVFVAKAGAVAVVAVAAAVIAGTVAVAGGTLLLRSAGVSATAANGKAWTTAGMGVLVVALYALAGLGLGMIVRHDAVALTGSVVWVTVVEGALPIVLRRPTIADWLPGGAASRLLMAAGNEPHALGLPAALVLLVGVVAALVAVGWARLARLDVS